MLADNLDIATGTKSTIPQAGGATTAYSTTGDADTFGVKMKAPPAPAPTCYVLSLSSTCTDEEAQALADGQGVIKNYVLQTQNSTTGSGSGSSGGGSGPKNSGASRQGTWLVSGYSVLAFVLTVVFS